MPAPSTAPPSPNAVARSIREAPLPAGARTRASRDLALARRSADGPWMTPAWSRKTWAGSLSRGWLGMLGPGAAARTLAVVEAQIPQESLHRGRHPLGRPGPGQGRDG